MRTLSQEISYVLSRMDSLLVDLSRRREGLSPAARAALGTVQSAALAGVVGCLAVEDYELYHRALETARLRSAFLEGMWVAEVFGVDVDLRDRPTFESQINE